MASFIGRKALNVAGRPSDRAAQRLGCMPSCSPPAPLTHPLAVSCLPSQLCFLSTWAAPILARELSLLPSQAFHGSTRWSSLPWMAKMLLVCGLALLQNGELLSFGPHTYVQQTGFAARGPAAAAPYVGTAALPKLSPEYRDERILSVPHAMRMGAQHMQPSPFLGNGPLQSSNYPLPTIAA